MIQKFFISARNLSILLIGTLFISCAGINITNDSQSINTSTGIVTGISENQVVMWEDIPYALPPIGDLRWRAPRAYLALSLIHI